MNKMKRTNIIFKESGSLILPILGVVAAIGMLTYYLGSYFAPIQRGNSSAQIKDTIDLIQKQVIAVIENPDGWAESVRNTPNLNCLLNNGQVCAAHQGRLAVHVAPGYPLISRNNDVGFSLSGKKCDNATGGFSNQGNDLCPFLFEIDYRIDCGGPPNCVSVKDPASPVASFPRVVVTGTFSFNPATEKNFPHIKSESFNFSFTRGVETALVREPCEAMGGQFSEATKFCRLRAAQMSPCPPNSFMTGFDEAGNRICRNMPGIANVCADGAGIVGFQAGRFLCGKY